MREALKSYGAILLTCVVVQVLFCVVAGRSYLSRHNTLVTNGNWVSTKTTLDRGLNGSFAFITQPQALAGGGLDLGAWGSEGSDVLKRVYGAMVPKSQSNSRVPRRLENKLAYALKATEVEIRFFHKNSEPPLTTYGISHDLNQFSFNELGWQDQITVTVRHDLALLPGPGRLLARLVKRDDGSPDRVSERIERVEGVYVYPLNASITMCNEGEKPVIPYEH